MRIHIASDHAGLKLKHDLAARLTDDGHTVVDHGAHIFDAADDYPTWIIPAAEAVVVDPGSLGIVIGGSGNGEQIAANKVGGVRAALAYTRETASLARRHNDANVLSLGARMQEADEHWIMVRAFVETPFSGEGRHSRRIAQVAAYEGRPRPDPTRRGAQFGGQDGAMTQTSSMQTSAGVPLAATSDDVRVWVDGTLYADPREARVSAIDHGIVVGDGVFEAFKAVNGMAFTPTRHLARLERSAAALGLPAPDLGQVRAGMDAVLDGFNHPLGLFRITYTGGRGPLGSGMAYGPTTLVVALQPSEDKPASTAIVTTPWERNVRGAMSGVKSTSYAENVKGLAHAFERDATEGIFANTDGHLCEGTGSNVFCVFGDEVVTPPLSAAPLAGITRGLVLEWGSAADVRMVERDLTVDEAKRADEVFLTSSSRDVQGVHRWDDVTWEAPGPITARLRTLWEERAAADLDPA